MTEPPEEDVMSAQDGLEQCRRNMEGRERELQEVTTRLAAEALAKRKQGDSLMARSKLMERRRVMKRLERLRQGLELVDTQLDAIKSSELDKEIMLTLKASTNAMRKAGINLGIQEVENVMSELDEQMREAHDVTSVLSNPLIMLSGQQGGMMGGGAQLEDAELDAELDLLEQSSGAHPPTPRQAGSQPDASQTEPAEQQQQQQQQQPVSASRQPVSAVETPPHQANTQNSLIMEDNSNAAA